TLGAATLNLNSNSALNNGNLVISGSAILNNASGSAKTFSNNVNFNNTLTFTGTNDLTFGQLILSANTTRNLVGNGGRLTFTNGANFSNSRLQKTGAGTLVLNAAGT